MNNIEYDTTNWSDGDIAVFEAIVNAEKEAVAMARSVIDSYWVKFDSSNRIIMNNKRTGTDPKHKVAVIAPVIEAGASTGRKINRLIWRTFGTEGYQRNHRGAGRRVAFSRGDYEYTYSPNSLLKHSVGWDAKLILEAETKLEPIRLALKNYQRILVSIAARYRRVSRLTEKRVNTYGE